MEVSSASRTKILDALVAKSDADQLSPSVWHTVRQHELLAGALSLGEDVAARYLCTLVKLLDGKDEALAAKAADRLGCAAQECSVLGFVQQYQQWIAKLLPILRGTSSVNLRTSCWGTLGKIYGRVQQVLAVPGIRKDASQPVKEIQQMFLYKFDTDLETLQVAKMRALSSVVGAVAPAVRSNAKALETALLTRVIFSEEGSVGCNARLAASQLLALLTQTAGDKATWSTLMQQLIATSHQVLDGAFLGLEDPAAVQSARSAVQPRLPPLAGDRQWPSATASAARERAWLDTLAGLLDCMERLMTQAQPHPVALPSSALFMLLARMLALDDSAAANGRTPSSTSAYLELISALPSLHAAALKLLAVWLRAGKSALTPFFASTCRLLSDLLGRASLRSAVSQAAWQVRQEVYLSSCEMITLAGLGAACSLLEGTKACAAMEFIRASAQGDGPSPRPTKRQKRSKQAEKDLPSGESAAAEAARKLGRLRPSSQELGCRQACQKLLLSLIRGGGAMLELEQRLQLDLLALHAARQSSQDLASAAEGSPSHRPTDAAALQLHLGCLETLLAAVATPSPARPAFLPQAMQLFKQGLHSSHPGVASFCTSAMLHCEAFMHPRTAVQLLEPVSESHLPAAGSFQRAFPEPWRQSGKDGGGVSPSPAAMPKGNAQGPEQTDARQEARKSSEAASEPESPQAQAAIAAQAVAAPPGMASGSQTQPLAESQPLNSENGGQEPEAGSGLERTRVAATVPSHVGVIHANESKVAGPAASTKDLKQEIPLADGLSSDSEGPLPEIDSGESSDEDDE